MPSTFYVGVVWDLTEFRLMGEGDSVGYREEHVPLAVSPRKNDGAYPRDKGHSALAVSPAKNGGGSKAFFAGFRR